MFSEVLQSPEESRQNTCCNIYSDTFGKTGLYCWGGGGGRSSPEVGGRQLFDDPLNV